MGYPHDLETHQILADLGSAMEPSSSTDFFLVNHQFALT